MNWIESLKALGFTTATQVLLLIVIGFWGKKIVEYFLGETIEIRKKELAQELQLHKNKLEQENNLHKLDIDKSLEEYKNKLELLKLEYQVQFSELHNTRSKVIEQLYEKLGRLNVAILDLTTGHFVIKDAEQEELDRLVEFDKSYFGFQKYYIEKKIFFEPEVCSILEKLKDHYWQSALDLTEINRMKAMGAQGSDLKESREKWREAGNFVKQEIPKVLELLEIEFRKLLGVISNEAK